MNAAVSQAAQVTPPTTHGTVSVTATSSAAEDLSGFIGKWVTMNSDVAVHVRFGLVDVGAAVVATHYRIPANTEKSFLITSTTAFMRVIGTTGTLWYADSSDAPQ